MTGNKNPELNKYVYFFKMVFIIFRVWSSHHQHPTKNSDVIIHDVLIGTAMCHTTIASTIVLRLLNTLMCIYSLLDHNNTMQRLVLSTKSYKYKKAPAGSQVPPPTKCTQCVKSNLPWGQLSLIPRRHILDLTFSVKYQLAI